MPHIFREVETWGTVIFFEGSSPTLNEVELKAAADEIERFLFHVDEVFSTYKESSFISQLRGNQISIDDCPEEVRGVWNATAFARDISAGLFDPWCVAGGYDPSGYVKGWAADRAADIFADYGVTECVINAGGDLTVRSSEPKRIAIANPDNRDEVVHSLLISRGAVATSGVTERGSHIRDPHTGLIAIGAKSATVWGPDGGIADALATALIVSGKDGAGIFAHPQLEGYHCFVIDRNEDFSWSI